MADPNEVLFQITPSHLNTGLRGVPVGTCRTSRVDPEKGVSYVGYPIKELARLDPESVIYLLLERELPDPEQLAAFKDDMRSRAGVPPEVLDSVARLPRDGHPMEWLISAILMLGMATKTDDVREDARNLIARAPELVAAIFRLHHGWGEPIAPMAEKGHIENFVHMLGVPGADAERLRQVLRVFFVLHMDHGGGNLSTFTGKAVASANSGIYPSIAAAMAGLYGPLHGRANQDCLEFVRKVGSTDPDDVEQFIRDSLARGEKIYGFGHAVLRAEDPRATVQYEMGQRYCADDPLFQTALAMRERAVKVLKEHPKISNPYPNVDAVSGSLLSASGLTDSNYYTVLFGLSRITGICAQIIDERTDLRNGKPVPIYRPKYVAVGQSPRHLEG